MRYINFYIIGLIVFHAATALATTNTLTLYKDNYFVVGKYNNDANDQGKVQMSCKYKLFRPDNRGMFLGLTNTFWWQVYEKSRKIRESNYNIDFFHKSKLHDKSVLIQTNRVFSPEYYQVGIAHTSNGMDSIESRSINFIYGQVQFSRGARYNIGTNIKILEYFRKSIHNRDIKAFTGNAEYEIFFRFRNGSKKIDNEKISYKFMLGDNSSFTKGQQELTFMMRLFSLRVRPFLYFRYENGYGVDGLVDYNKKNTAYKVGIVLK